MFLNERVGSLIILIKMKKVLVLGKNGMLGHMVYGYLSSLNKYDVSAIDKEELDVLKFSDQEIESVITRFSPSYVINAMGLINKSPILNEQTAKRLNTDFPHLLAYLGMKQGWKLIHISTDCYLDEDLYGRSKFFGEVNDHHNLTVRTSIIGPELNPAGFGLFNWFMTQEGSVSGFTKAYWDGVTTLQFAKFVDYCISEGNLTGVVDYRTKESLSKHDLLGLIAKVFGKKIEIRGDDREMKDKRNLNADFWCEEDYESQLVDLKHYMENNLLYKRYFSK